MFTAHQLREMMNAQPFKPFRIHMSDGSTFEIPNHDAAFIKRNAIAIGLNTDADGFADRYRDYALMHITSIEELQPA